MSPARERVRDLDDDYEILKKLGAGGMGEVFLANKLGLDGQPLKTVVIKRILPHLADTPDRVQRFLDEMTVAARLEHRNVVRVSDWGQLMGSYFIEMELVRGMSVDELLRHRATEGKLGPLPPVDVAWIGMQVCRGLDYAHTLEHGDTMGVLHRDISTDNIMVDVDGEVRIADWGIAKALRGVDRVASETDHAHGKSYYMPPEQWRGEELDARADLYALGITLVVALAGRQVYEAGANDTVPSLMLRVFNAERPSVAELAPHAPAAMLEILERMIATDRAQRPRTAAELVEPFKEVAKQLGGDLHRAQHGLGERVRENYAMGAPTERSMPAMARPDAAESADPVSPVTQREDDVGFSRSHKRLVSQVPTRDERLPRNPTGTALEGDAAALPRTPPTEPMMPPAKTVPVPAPVQSVGGEPQGAARRPTLVIALGVTVAILIVMLMAAILGIGVDRFGAAEPETVAPPSPPESDVSDTWGLDEDEGLPMPEASEREAVAEEEPEAPAPAPPVAAPEPPFPPMPPRSQEPFEPPPVDTGFLNPGLPFPEERPPATTAGRAQSRRQASPPNPEPRPLPSASTPPTERATHRTPGVSDFGF